MASAAKALRFERSSDPEEPATRKARRGPSRSLSLLLSFSISSHSALFASLLLPSSRLPFCPTRGVTAPCRTRDAHSSPILRIALYFLRLALLFVSAFSSSSASPVVRKTWFRGERPGIRINLICASTCFLSSGNKIAM